jgi:hypothetical protein
MPDQTPSPHWAARAVLFKQGSQAQTVNDSRPWCPLTWPELPRQAARLYSWIQTKPIPAEHGPSRQLPRYPVT